MDEKNDADDTWRVKVFQVATSVFHPIETWGVKLERFVDNKWTTMLYNVQHTSRSNAVSNAFAARDKILQRERFERETEHYYLLPEEGSKTTLPTEEGVTW